MWNGNIERRPAHIARCADARDVLRFDRDFSRIVPDEAEDAVLVNATQGLHRYWHSAFTERMSDDLIDVLVDGVALYFPTERADFLFCARRRQPRDVW